VSAVDIFGDTGEYTVYRAEIQVRDLLVGGVPGDPSVIRKWLESRLDVTEQLLQEIFEETVQAVNAPMSMEEKVDAVMKSPQAPSANQFKRLESGELAYEGRCLKAALKEWANSAYPGNDWDGKTGAKGVAPRKGLMSTLAERVFVDPTLIPLGVKFNEIGSQAGVGQAWIEERVKHPMTPKGPISAINRVEVVLRPRLEFRVKVRDDFLPHKTWGRIWQTGEEIGIGADRGRSDGRFDLLTWEPI